MDLTRVILCPSMGTAAPPVTKARATIRMATIEAVMGVENLESMERRSIVVMTRKVGSSDLVGLGVTDKCGTVVAVVCGVAVWAG